MTERGIDYSIDWRIIEQARSYNGLTCNLCLSEKSLILFNPASSQPAQQTHRAPFQMQTHGKVHVLEGTWRRTPSKRRNPRNKKHRDHDNNNNTGDARYDAARRPWVKVKVSQQDTSINTDLNSLYFYLVQFRWRFPRLRQHSGYKNGHSGNKFQRIGNDIRVCLSWRECCKLSNNV